jgi:hypothetical protein
MSHKEERKLLAQAGYRLENVRGKRREYIHPYRGGKIVFFPSGVWYHFLAHQIVGEGETLQSLAQYLKEDRE